MERQQPPVSAHYRTRQCSAESQGVTATARLLHESDSGTLQAARSAASAHGVSNIIMRLPAADLLLPVAPALDSTVRARM